MFEELKIAYDESLYVQKNVDALLENYRFLGNNMETAIIILDGIYDPSVRNKGMIVSMVNEETKRSVLLLHWKSGEYEYPLYITKKFKDAMGMRMLRGSRMVWDRTIANVGDINDFGQNGINSSIEERVKLLQQQHWPWIYEDDSEEIGDEMLDVDWGDVGQGSMLFDMDDDLEETF